MHLYGEIFVKKLILHKITVLLLKYSDLTEVIRAYFEIMYYFMF